MTRGVASAITNPPSHCTRFVERGVIGVVVCVIQERILCGIKSIAAPPKMFAALSMRRALRKREVPVFVTDILLAWKYLAYLVVLCSREDSDR